MRGRVNSVVFQSSSSVPDGKTVTPVNDVEIWQKCAGISSPTYSTLAGVLSDNSLLMTLMASDNAVDYMVRSTDWATEQSVPAMSSNTTSAGAVPTMTSNIAPSGVCFAGGEEHLNESQLYLIFDQNDSTRCDNTAWSDSQGPCWIGYEFTAPIKCDRFDIYLYGVESGVTRINTDSKFKVQCSVDGINYEDESDWFNTSDYYGQKYTLSCSSPKSGRYHRIYWNVQPHYHMNLQKYDIDSIYTIQFYPPSGRVLVSTEGSQTYEKGYLAFTDASGYWTSTAGATQYIGYMFTAPTYVYKVSYLNRPTIAGPKVAKFQGSTDGTTWVDLGDFPNCSTANTTYTATYVYSAVYTYYRISI